MTFLSYEEATCFRLQYVHVFTFTVLSRRIVETGFSSMQVKICFEIIGQCDEFWHIASFT